MPTFCRHNRFVESCPICSKTPRTRPGTVGGQASAAARRPAAPKAPTAGKRRTRTSSDVVVKRVARAADDGYANGLVPGLRATADAERLADQLAFSVARLHELRADPPGPYAEAAAAPDREEGLWLALQIAYVSPTEDDAPFAGIEAARVPFATGELPLVEDVPLGPRTGVDARRGDAALVNYRAWAARAGSQQAALAGAPDWPAQRRFDRAFERLALPRSARYEFLVIAGALGLADVEPGSLHLPKDATHPLGLAAKRIFGIGDPILIAQRASELLRAAVVPFAALDLALHAFQSPEPITAGSDAAPDDAARERLFDVLGA